MNLVLHSDRNDRYSGSSFNSWPSRGESVAPSLSEQRHISGMEFRVDPDIGIMGAVGKQNGAGQEHRREGAPTGLSGSGLESGPLEMTSNSVGACARVLLPR